MRRLLELKPQVPTKRIKDLVVGDLFMYNMVEWEVVKKDDERVYFNSIQSKGNNYNSIGARAMALVEYLGRSPKSKPNNNGND